MPSPINDLEEGSAEILASLPHLAERVFNFQKILETEPCTHPGNSILPEGAEGGCVIISNIRQMCPACRTRMMFFHTIYNADAYHPELGQ